MPASTTFGSERIASMVSCCCASTVLACVIVSSPVLGFSSNTFIVIWGWLQAFGDVVLANAACDIDRGTSMASPAVVTIFVAWFIISPTVTAHIGFLKTGY